MSVFAAGPGERYEAGSNTVSLYSTLIFTDGRRETTVLMACIGRLTNQFKPIIIVVSIHNIPYHFLVAITTGVGFESILFQCHYR
jgi:hypothetical protein